MNTPATHPKRKKSTSWLKWLGIIVLVLAGGAFALYHFLPVDRILEQKLKAWLKESGVQAEFHISALNTHRLHVQDIGLADSDAFSIGSVDARYSIDSLRGKRVNTITVSDMKIIARETAEDKMHIEGLESATNSDEDKPFTLPALPFDVLTLENLQLIYKPLTGEPTTLSADITLYEDYTGKLHIKEMSLPLEKEEILLTDLVLTREDVDEPFAFTLANISHITADKAYFTPLKANGSFTLARDNKDFNGIMTIHDLRDMWTLNLKGDAKLDAGTWNIAFEQPAMAFETGILQPDTLFPVLRGAMTQTTGKIGFKGTASKTADAPMTTQGQLVLDNVGTVVKDIPVNGVSGTLEFSSLMPPTSKGKQSVHVKEILLGLPLKNGKMSFSLNKDGKTTFSPSTWDWEGGKLHTAGASLNLYKPSLPDITLSAEGIALENLLAGLLQKGVSATGSLSGVIPVHFTKERDAMIKNGRLGTEGGGIVRYIPNDESPIQMGNSVQTDILLQAMENFHYSEIGMTINSQDAHKIEVLLQVKGKNPELYNGQTIELNINLTGNLLDIVQSGMDVYTLPERLQEQLMQ